MPLGCSPGWPRSSRGLSSRPRPCSFDATDGAGEANAVGRPRDSKPWLAIELRGGSERPARQTGGCRADDHGGWLNGRRRLSVLAFPHGTWLPSTFLPEASSLWWTWLDVRARIVWRWEKMAAYPVPERRAA